MRQNWCNAGIRSYIQDYIRRCIDFDVDNSKINKIIKDKTALDHFKIMMLRYYRHFKDAFYYLSKDNPSILGIYSITQLDFIKFVEEQKYVTKRVTQAKILLKLYACLAAGEEDDLKKGKEGIGRKSEEKNVVKLLSRPQFLQFLVRLAVEKWCSFVSAKKKKEEINKQKMWEEQEKRQLQKRKSLKGIKKDKNSKIQKSPRVQKQSNKLPEEKQINKQQIEGDDGQQQQLQMKKFKLKLPLPLLDGLQRTMTTLYRFAQNYRSSIWRKRRYLKIDILIVLKAYEQIITSLYDKYTESKFKTNKPKKLSLLLTLEELRTMIMDADIKRTKEAMKQIDQAFLDSKRLEVEDGNMQFGLTIQQFQQCLARLASQIWFNPASASKSPMWDNQINRKCTPLFIRLQSFIIALYWRVPQIHNKRLTKIAEKGIFELQIELIMQKIQGLAEQMGSFTFLKRNSMQGDSEISLKDINDELREKYDKMVIHHEHEEQYETYVQHH